MKLNTMLMAMAIFTLIESTFIYGQKGNGNDCLVVGHRGASKIAPENTIAAAKLAWEQGADAVEVDVHLTSDNKIVVIHDKGTKRTAGVDLEVSKTLYEKLKDLDVGNWKDEKYKGEKIPLLEEVVAIIPDGKLLVVEIKSDKKIVPYIQQAFKDHAKVDQLIFIAFSYEAICEAKKAFPNNKSFWLSSSFNEGDKTVLEKVKADGLDGVDLNYRMLNHKLVETAHNLGLEVHVYTVNDLDKAKEMQSMGVRSITTDIPDQVLKVVSAN